MCKISLPTVKINNCVFPADYLYDVENFAWAHSNGDSDNGFDKLDNVHNKVMTIGITPVLSY
ncbi:MAG: hypothetical protein M3162_02440, partial [Thermoproteota archaeon]|nr:hypothetical protein [Thermoproteota archaeon]